jgi:hypothetical protein
MKCSSVLIMNEARNFASTLKMESVRTSESSVEFHFSSYNSAQKIAVFILYSIIKFLLSLLGESLCYESVCNLGSEIQGVHSETP